MAASKTPKAQEKKPIHKKKDRAAEIANTFEWLITAFILAFVFRAFVMEAFRIPTGSMADTLKGAHFRLRCPECGYKYDHGFVPRDYKMRQDTIPRGTVEMLYPTHCPSCGFLVPAGGGSPVANGDRILVLKCIYQFIEPKRWDVVVFKNPTDPSENYIKRLIGLPNEEIRIIDGDVYIDGQITRRPSEVQREHWMPIYEHDYQPVTPNQRGAFNGYRWRAPFDFEVSAWEISEENPTQLVLDSPTDQTLTYGGRAANDFIVTYAYNDVRMRRNKPPCGDLMVRFYVKPHSKEGRIGITLSKYGVDYRAWLDLDGTVTLNRVDGDKEALLKPGSVGKPALDAFTLVKFANVDHQLRFECNGTTISHDLGRSPDAMGGDPNVAPEARIVGAGKLTLSHLAIFRDIYYTSKREGGRTPRATKENPFTLNEDEFFVLGDNSPNSEDGRWWSQPSAASKGTEPPRTGVVPRYYLVGKALFVYWPSGFEFPWPAVLNDGLIQHAQRNMAARVLHSLISLRWIPNFGQMRFIYGGTNGQDAPSQTEAPVAKGVAD